MVKIALFAVEVMPGLWRVECPYCHMAHFLTGLGKQFGLCWRETEFSQNGCELVD